MIHISNLIAMPKQAASNQMKNCQNLFYNQFEILDLKCLICLE